MGEFQYSHYDNNRLLNCIRPQLIMKKNIDEDESVEGSFFRGVFTVVLDNPEIMEVVNNKGIMYLDNIISLRGLYEIEVQFMNIKKIISHNCLNWGSRLLIHKYNISSIIHLYYIGILNYINEIIARIYLSLKLFLENILGKFIVCWDGQLLKFEQIFTTIFLFL